MKKMIVFAFALCFCGLTGGQTFTFVPSATTLSDTLNSDIAFSLPIHNRSASPITVSVVRRQNQLPNEWVSSMCFDQSCFAPFIDSVATTADFGSAPIPPGGEVDFSMHVTPMMVHGIALIRLTAKNNANPADSISVLLTAKSKTVDVEDGTRPGHFSLAQNFPNPFNPSTTIRFELEKNSPVSLTVYDMYGRMVSQPVNGIRQAGSHAVQFQSGNLSSGAYYYELRTRETTIVKKMMLVR